VIAGWDSVNRRLLLNKLGIDLRAMTINESEYAWSNLAGVRVRPNDVERRSLAMAEIGVLKVGDRVTVAGQDGVFFVLSLDFETLSASLLPSDNGPIINQVPSDTLIFLSAPES